MELEYFLNQYNLKEDTIRKRIKDIPGISIENNEIKILEDSRYPYNIRKSKTSDFYSKMIIILKATSKLCYVDEKILKTSKNEFNHIINELLDANFLIKRKTVNKFGCNSYFITTQGDEFLKSKRKLNIFLKHIDKIAAMTLSNYLIFLTKNCKF